MSLTSKKEIPQNRVKMFSQLCLEKIENIQLTGYKGLLRDTLYIQRHIQVESKKMGKNYNVNSNKKTAGMAIQILGEIDFKTKIITREKKKHL